jgi:hypothetical protein
VIKIALGIALSLLVAACSPGEGSASIGAPGSAGGKSGVFVPSSSGGLFQGGAPPRGSSGSGVVVPECTKDCTDFPAAPLIDDKGPSAVPSDAAARFGRPDDFTGSGPCVIEPPLAIGSEKGALFPANWLRPRFRFEPAAGQSLFEIRLHAASQKNDLVAYTTRTTWELPGDIWTSLTKNSVNEPITVTIRALASGAASASSDGGKPAGTRGTFTIAPVTASGTLVYWATTSSDVTPTTSKLVGFRVGDEGVVDVLTVNQVQTSNIVAEGGRDLRGQYGDAKGVPAGHVECIGCHVSTPDGLSVGFTDHWPWNDVLASVEPKTTGQMPGYVTAGAQRLLNQPWLGMMTFSGAHFRDGDRIAVSSYAARSGDEGFSDSHSTDKDRLAWFDLETTATIPWQSGQTDPMNTAIRSASGSAWGFLALDGESRAALTPSFSHDGSRLVYTSAARSQDGRIGDDSETDIHAVPYADRRGGSVTPVTGAATSGVSEYYPSFSSDDTFIAFNRAAATSGKIYYRPDGEVYVVPAAGGTAVRLAANDPPACTGEKSPGIINSWAKWSPSVVSANGKAYYWLVFSSARKYPGAFEVPKNQYSPGDTRASQLYLAAVVVDGASGEMETYPGVYLYNQTATTSNLTPAWDEFQIPEVPRIE